MQPGARGLNALEERRVEAMNEPVYRGCIKSNVEGSGASRRGDASKFFEEVSLMKLTQHRAGCVCFAGACSA